MIDLDREMRALLEEDARLAPPVPEAEPALRRTRRRQLLVVAVALVSAVALVAGAATGITALIRSSERRVPANPPATADWSQFGYGPGRTFSNPTETTLTTANVAGLHLAWKTDLGRDVDTSPVVVDGVVYVGSNHENEAGLSAVEASTGEILWSVGGLPPPVTSPAVIGGTVIVGTGTGTRAFDAATGAELWTRPGQATLPPAIAGDIAYVASSPGAVAALDPSSGDEIWSTRPTTSIPSSFSPGTPVEEPGGIAVADGVVYVGAAGELLALDASTGTILWRHRGSTPDSQRSVSMPLVTEGVVYAMFQYWLVALDAADGSPLWSEFLIEPAPTTASEHGVVFGHVESGLGIHYLFARDAATGAVLWGSRDINEAAPGSISSSLAVTNGVLYVIHVRYPGLRWESSIEALDASTGESLWTEPVGGWIPDELARYDGLGLPPPAISEGVVYVGGFGSHQLLAFHL